MCIMQEGAADGGHIAQQVAGNSAAPAGGAGYLTYSSDIFPERKNKADLSASNVILLLACRLDLN